MAFTLWKPAVTKTRHVVSSRAGISGLFKQEGVVITGPYF